MNTSYVNLEPGITSQLGLDSALQSSFQTGQAVSLFASTSFLWMLGIMLCIGATGFVFIRGSLWRMEASDRGITKSNEEFKRGTLGLLGVLSLWLILYTLNRGMITGNVGLEGLRSVGGTYGGGGASGAVLPPDRPATIDAKTGSEAIKNDPAVRAQLNGNNISVNKPVCGDPTQTNCTTVGGLPGVTLIMLSNLRKTCGGKIEVTGGTEAGHSSHGPGKTPVDISLGDTTLNSCIGKFSRGPEKNFCFNTYSMFGFIFCDEKNAAPHWHVYQ